MVNQVELCAAMYNELSRQGVKTMNIRQMNAVIAAANAIIDQLDRPHQAAEPGMGADAWLASDDRGTSSEWLLARLLARPEPRFGYPRYPSDLGRCIRMLQAVPEAASAFARADASAWRRPWPALVKNWGRLVEAYEWEAPTGHAPECYAMMREMLEGGEA